MTLEQLEAEVLALPKDSQVILLARLLERLGQNSEIAQENTASWVEEAEKRDAAMSAGQVAVFLLKKCFNAFVPLYSDKSTVTKVVFHPLAERKLAKIPLFPPVPYC